MRRFLYLIPWLAVLLASRCAVKSSGQNMSEHEFTNDLIHETSPYLLQHAHNPVNWMPWGDKAFEKAKLEDKLVLVSVGYSACHWCHVMEHETFEDSTAAAFMNENFVCIKVDREERPDVDQVYMNAVQLMTKGGGWPLNCFALADGRPVYGGTYFPKNKWMEVMESLVELKKRDPMQMNNYADQLTNGIIESELISRVEEDPIFLKEDLNSMVKNWSKIWDFQMGGAKKAPKFPLPNNYEFLMSYAELEKDQRAAEFVELTLDKISQGGIYDQVGGGFARYSTDMNWKVPHFEKMLYDNAQLVSLYSQAYSKIKDEDYKRTIVQTLDFVQRELTGENGEFYSALDADSEGEEGKFYIWTKEELKELLTAELFEFAQDYYNLNAQGKWEHDHYILLRNTTAENWSNKTGNDLNVVLQKIEEINTILLEKRKSRVRPGLDDKTLTSWNGLMIKGYADAYKALGDESYKNTALRNAEFIWENQYSRGALNHTYKGGKSTINGYLEDYCFVIEAYIALYEISFDELWLERAKKLMDYAIEHFYDENSGMFWFTSDVDPPLIARKMETSDSVIPSSNSSIAKGLYLLGTYYSNEDYMAKSQQMLNNILPDLQYGQYYSNWGILMEWFTHSFIEIAITGSESQAKLKEINSMYIPNKVIMGHETSSNLPLLQGKFLDETTIFVCQNKTCKLPVSKVEEAVQLISDIREE